MMDSSSDVDRDAQQKAKEEKLREDFLKNSVQDMNTLYESLGKSGRSMRIRPEEEYWIFSARPEKNEAQELEK
jgi:hypothetical protein